jgi:outer membrane protein OmpA-like peptidoglycan-associated protein
MQLPQERVMNNEAVQQKLGSALLLVAALVLASGCIATRRYTRNAVQESSNTITAAMDEKDRNLQQAISNNASEIEELGSRTSEHTRQITALEAVQKETDQKVAQAVSAGQAAQSATTQATSQLTTRANQADERFKERNRYMTSMEQRVSFRSDSASVPEEDAAVLDQVALQVKGNPDAILVLEGRTDAAGDESSNIRLGQRRIEAVSRYLVVDKEVPIHQIHSMSYGEARPIADNTTPEGRQQNRSVVLKVLMPAGSTGQVASR